MLWKTVLQAETFCLSGHNFLLEKENSPYVLYLMCFLSSAIKCKNRFKQFRTASWGQNTESCPSTNAVMLLCTKLCSFLFSLLYFNLLLCIDPWLCLSVRKNIFRNYFMSFLLCTCLPSTVLLLRSRREIFGDFWNTKDSPCTRHCFEKSQVCGKEVREQTPAGGRKKYLCHWHSFLCNWDGQIFESWPPLRKNKTYLVINPYKRDVCC